MWLLMSEVRRIPAVSQSLPCNYATFHVRVTYLSIDRHTYKHTFIVVSRCPYEQNCFSVLKILDIWCDGPKSSLVHTCLCYVHIYIYTEIYIHMYIYIYTHIYMLYLSIYIYTHSHTHIYIYIYRYTHIHTHLYIYMYTCMCVRIFIYMLLP